MALITLNGMLVRTQTITQTIELKSPAQFATTEASVEFFNPDGRSIPSPPATQPQWAFGLSCKDELT
jgi:hypothetical protein